MALPELAYRANVSPAARLVLSRMWDLAHPTTVPAVCWGTLYKIQLCHDLRMTIGSIDRAINDLRRTAWLIRFTPYDRTGAFMFELYTGGESCTDVV
jgi:hypothetical protein